MPWRIRPGSIFDFDALESIGSQTDLAVHMRSSREDPVAFPRRPITMCPPSRRRSVQVRGEDPFDINYINPDNDPQKAAKKQVHFKRRQGSASLRFLNKNCHALTMARKRCGTHLPRTTSASMMAVAAAVATVAAVTVSKAITMMMMPMPASPVVVAE